MITTNADCAYNQGYSSYFTGKGQSDCPYDQDSPLHAAWKEGYADADIKVCEDMINGMM